MVEPNKETSSLTKEQAHLIAEAYKRLDNARVIASERMHDLCIGCLYKNRDECPLVSVRDLETLYALMPDNCKRWKPRFGRVERG